MYRRSALVALASLSTAGCLRLSDEQSQDAAPSTDDDGGTQSNGDETPEADVWVAPGGEGGDGSEDAPFTDIEEALSEADPGETVYVQSGEYRLNGTTHGDGKPGAPIELTGPEDAVLRAQEGQDPVFSILNSHVHVTGCTFDGLANPERQWTDPEVWSRTVVQISPGPRYEAAGVDYLEDVVFEPHAMRNAGSGFVHVERTRNAEIGDFELTGPGGGEFHPDMENALESHIGHVFSVGASPPTIQEYKPWDGLDRTRNVRLHHVNNSAGYHHSAFADVRVGAEEITVEYCTDRNAGNETSGKDIVPAVSIGGNNCTVRGNDFGDCRQGVSFGAWTPIDMADASNWARNNDVYSNRFQGVERDVFLFFDTTESAQRALCNNRLITDDESEYAYATGECDADVPSVDGIGYDAAG